MSASEHSESIPFNLSAKDVKRQAVNAWHGYEYQLLQAFYAWLTLPEGAQLYLEVAEDHAVLQGEQIDQTQVKNIAGNITLRSGPVVELLESHWRLVGENLDLDVHSTLLTTAKVTKEADTVFPDGKPGLEYWRAVARNGTDIEPLRKFLLTLELSENLKQFIEGASAEDFRRRLIRPIKWACASDGLETMRQLVDEKLIYLGDKYKLVASASTRTREVLLAELREVILNKRIRRVSQADLYQAFEDATHVSVPRAVAEEIVNFRPTSGDQLAISAPAGLVTDVSRIALPQRLTHRYELVAQMFALAASQGLLWLHGSTGLGKTVLALMMGRYADKGWIFVDLQGCTSQEVKYRLAIASQHLAAGMAHGVIVDDYSVESQATLLSLSQLRMEAHLQDATLVITSNRTPPPSAKSCLGGDVQLEELPYLSEEDVGSLIIQAGGDATRWAQIVHLATGGHPRLVAVKILSLESKNWAVSEAIKDLAPLLPSHEMKAERAVINAQLPDLLPENSLELLYRLSFLMNGFDRQLALAVGESQEPVKRPGAAFDILVGPWVDFRGEDKYSLSPLVRNCGGTVISGTQQSIIRKSIVSDLRKRVPFPAEHLNQLFLNAYAERMKEDLVWFAESMQLSMIRNRDDFKMIAREVSIIFNSLSTNESLFPEDKYIAAMLRIVQCFVALETGLENFSRVFDQTLADCKEVENKEISAGLLVVVLFKTLTRQGVALSPRKWLPLVEEFSKIAETTQGARSKAFTEAMKDNPQGWTVAQLLFVIQASSLPNIASLSELMQLLHEFDAAKRRQYLSALNAEGRNRKLTVFNAWVNQAKVEELDGLAFSNEYKKFADLAKAWGEKDLQIDCTCAQAVLLDEYGDSETEALAVLDEAIKELGEDHRLLRRRQVVLVNGGRHEEALQAMPQISSGSAFDSIDLVYTLRDAGRSACETGKLDESRQYLSQAAAAANCAPQPLIPMSAGLLADAAYVAYLQSDYADSLNLLKQAIIKAESIGPQPTDLEKYCLIILGAFFIWLLENIQEGIAKRDWKVGICSNPNPNPDVITQGNVPQQLILWYQLAILEALLGVDVGALADLKARRAKNGFGLQAFEEILASALMGNIIKNVDVEEFLCYLPEFLTLNAVPRADGESVVCKPVASPLVPIAQAKWEENYACVFYFENTVIAFAMQAIASDKEIELDSLVQKISVSLSPDSRLGKFLELLSEVRMFQTPGLSQIGVNCAANLREGKKQISAGMALGLTYFLWWWLMHSQFRTAIEDSLAECVSSIWRKIITDKRFSLSNPGLYVPLIESILDGQTRGITRLATLALEAESASSSTLSHEMRVNLRDFLKKTKP